MFVCMFERMCVHCVCVCVQAPSPFILRHLVVKVAVDYVEDHAEDVDKEADDEEDELCDVDPVDKVDGVVDPRGVDSVLVCGVCVDVPAEEREVDDGLQPVAPNKEQAEHKGVYCVLGKDKGLKAPGKVCRGEVDVKVTVRNQLDGSGDGRGKNKCYVRQFVGETQCDMT